MGKLWIASEDKVIDQFEDVKSFLNQNGVFYDRWNCGVELTGNESQEEILKAYDGQLKPLMEQGGYKTCDVVSVNARTEGIEKIRAMFLKEHTHAEDEVRFFVRGHGLFWFNLNGEQSVFSLECVKGDILSVPAGAKHWFDLGEDADVVAIRIFTDPSGWVAEYTESGIDAKFNK